MAKILISPGYGAGWSTWNVEHFKFLLTDPTLVRMAENKTSCKDVKKYLRKTLNCGVYLGGWTQVEVIEVPDGSEVLVEEYDGYETYRLRDDDSGWIKV